MWCADPSAVFERYNIVSSGDLRDAAQRLDRFAASHLCSIAHGAALRIQENTVMLTHAVIRIDHKEAGVLARRAARWVRMRTRV